MNSYVPHFKRHRKELLARIQSVGCEFFPSLDFFGSFFGYEKKNKPHGSLFQMAICKKKSKQMKFNYFLSPNTNLPKYPFALPN